jgi:hypothetical protein
MGNNKDKMKGGSKDSPLGNKPDREFETQGTKKSFDKEGQKAGSPGKSTGSPNITEDDDMKTAGGRQGQFSDKDRSSQGQWSPGKGESHS